MRSIKKSKSKRKSLSKSRKSMKVSRKYSKVSRKTRKAIKKNSRKYKKKKYSIYGGSKWRRFNGPDGGTKWSQVGLDTNFNKHNYLGLGLNFDDLKTKFMELNDINDKGQAKESSGRLFLSTNKKDFTKELTVIQVDDSTQDKVVLTLYDIITEKMEDKHKTKNLFKLTEQEKSTKSINQLVPTNDTIKSVEKPYRYYSTYTPQTQKMKIIGIIKLWGWAGIKGLKCNHTSSIIDYYKEATENIISSINVSGSLDNTNCIIIHWDGDPQVDKYKSKEGKSFEGKFSHAIFLPFVIETIKEKLSGDFKIHIIMTKVDSGDCGPCAVAEKIGKLTDNELQIIYDINEAKNNTNIFPFFGGVDDIDVIVQSIPYNSEYGTEYYNEMLLQHILTKSGKYEINDIKRYCILIGGNANNGLSGMKKLIDHNQQEYSSDITTIWDEILYYPPNDDKEVDLGTRKIVCYK